MLSRQRGGPSIVVIHAGSCLFVGQAVSFLSFCPPCWMLCSWASLLRIIQVLLSVFTLSSAYYSLLEHKAHVFPCINVLELMRSIYIPCCPVKAVCVWVVVSAHTICSVINCDTFWPRQLFLLSYISYVNALAWLCWSFHGVIRKNLCFWFHIWSFVLNISLQLKRRKLKIETDPMYFLNFFPVLLCTILTVFLTISAVYFP